MPFAPARAGEWHFRGEQCLPPLASSAARLVWADKCLELLCSPEKLGNLDVNVAVK